MVVRAGLLQGIRQALQLFRGEGLCAGQVDGHRLLAGGRIGTILQGQALAQNRLSRLLCPRHGDLAVVAHHDHGAALELNVHRDAQNQGGQNHDCRNAAGNAQEHLALAGHIQLLGRRLVAGAI